LQKHYSLLMCAARNNRSDVVDFLLDTLDDMKVDAVDLEQQTALFHAALGGHAGIARRLVEAGARTDVRNKVPLRRDVGNSRLAEFVLKM
jgi:ankyrin repeat protein